MPIANVSFVGSENMLDLLQETGKTNGTDYTRNLINSQVVPSYHDESIPAVNEFRRLLKQFEPVPPRALLSEDYLPRPPCFVSLEGFLNAKLLVTILTKMEFPLERLGIKYAAESMEDLHLGTGEPVYFRADRHQAMDRIYYTVVEEGRFVPLNDWKRWSK